MSIRRLSFKYKLALSFSAIIISIVAVAFLLIGSLTKQFLFGNRNLRSVLEHLRTYQETAEFEDDATIVVVKMALDECP